MIFPILNRWLPSATLALWGGVSLYFYYSDRLAAFLHPTFRPGVMIAGWLLCLMAVLGLFGPRPDACCEEEGSLCNHSLARLTGGRLAMFAVLVVPVSLSFVSTRDGFSLTTMENRGVITDASALVGKMNLSASQIEQGLQAQQQEEPDSPLRVSVIDLLYGAQDPALARELAGKRVEVVGQLMPASENNPKGNRKRVVRMYMSCCASDARPIAVLAEFPGPVNEPEMAWVRVIGTPQFVTEGGKTIVVVKVEELYRTEAPDETMLF